MSAARLIDWNELDEALRFYHSTRGRQLKKNAQHKMIYPRSFDLNAFFGFQTTIYNPECAIFQDG
jgi:hypothetical protein